MNLLYSLFEGPDAPQYVRERIQHWNLHRRKDLLEIDDAEGVRDDLPDKFSELQDSHFPLFVTVDTVSTTLATNKWELITPGPSYSCGASLRTTCYVAWAHPWRHLMSSKENIGITSPDI
jgi:hypothetical protein